MNLATNNTMADIKLTSLDSNQLPRYTYDANHNAQRVVIVGNNTVLEPDVRYFQGPASEPQIVEKIVTQIEYRTVEVPKIITEYKTIEVPIIIKEIEIKEVEKIVFVAEVKKIEMPLVIKEKELVYIDKINYKMLFIMQGITLALIILSKLLK